ncbi:hypothetical protein ACLESO_33380 [Pyxidicoccus sp. 3LG]
MHTAATAAHTTPVAAGPSGRVRFITTSPTPRSTAPETIHMDTASPSHSTDTGQTSSMAPPRDTVYASPSGACFSARDSAAR